jgi:diguanylate cyclase (GGDEF)-like protein
VGLAIWAEASSVRNVRLFSPVSSHSRSTKSPFSHSDHYRVTSSSYLEPRDRVAAGRTLAAVALVGAIVLVTYVTLDVVIGSGAYPYPTLLQATLIGMVLVIVAVVAGSFPEQLPPWAWAGSAVIGVLLVLGLSLMSGDTRAAGQVALPVIYAAAHLRPVVAWTVTVLALASQALVSFVYLPPTKATTDTLVVGGGIIVVTIAMQTLSRYQENLNMRLAEIAAIDQLTGLTSRGRLEEIAQEVLATECLPGDFTLGTGLAIIDVDHFKSINDTYGHPVGDSALVHIAALLRGSCPPRATVARLGGDELAVLMPCVRVEDLKDTLTRFHDAVRTSPMNHLGRVLPLSVSVGGAHVPVTRDVSLVTLYTEADEALYQAKLRGRGRVVVA